MRDANEPMTGSSTPTTLLGRHLRGLQRSLGPALDGDIEGVHKVRVSSRRLRELLPVIAGSKPNRHGRRLRRFASRVARAFGPVSKKDVAGELLRTTETRRGLQGIAAVHATIRRERDRRRRTMLAQLDRDDPVRKLKRLAEPDAFVSGAPSHDTPALVAARILARGARLEDAIEAAGSLYETERLHQVRIAVKKLRYALELIPELHLGQTSADLKRLKDTQDLLGSLHDFEVLAAFARTLDEHASRRGLRTLLAALDEELRHHHAHYLRRRASVMAVIGRARQRSLELVAHEPGAAPVIIGEC